MSDLHHPDQSKASDAREEPKLPHPSTEDTKIGDTDATIVDLRDTIAELESNNAEKTKIAEILTAHVKENAQSNIDQIQKTRTAMENAFHAIESLSVPKYEPMPKMEPLVLPKFPRLNVTELLVDAYNNRVMEFQSQIKQLVRATGVKIDEENENVGYIAELVQQATDEIRLMREELASLKAK
ncbi:hypothetical protein BKA81DRAFT_369190 [Phyllosticta paracitricarpa]